MKKRYVDGFVLPLRKDRLADYEVLCEKTSQIWKDHGALEYWECRGDDLRIDEMRSFIDAAGAGDDETVVFSWVVFESKEARDKANEAIMSDPRMMEIMDPENPIMDCSRMLMGGFEEMAGS